MPRGVGTCHREKGEGCAFAEDECELVHRATPFCVSFMKTLAQQLHLQIVPSLLARLSSQPVGQKKLANSIPRTAKVQSMRQRPHHSSPQKKANSSAFSIFTASKQRCVVTAGPVLWSGQRFPDGQPGAPLSWRLVPAARASQRLISAFPALPERSQGLFRIGMAAHPHARGLLELVALSQVHPLDAMEDPHSPRGIGRFPRRKLRLPRRRTPSPTAARR